VSENERIDLDRVHALMMAALDDECSSDERRELEASIEQNAALAAEWARLRRVKEVTTTVALYKPPEEVWDRYRVTLSHRVERSVAWILLLFGAAVLGGWGLWHWLGSVIRSDAPIIIKAAIVAVVAGGVLLLGSVVRERWFLHRRDPYSREVIR
jgi:anti-sigma factor RsiW